MTLERLREHRKIWNKKKILRDIYHHWYAQIIENMVDVGPTLEIGGGGGNLKEFLPELISSDYTFCPWLDVNLDAHNLPFGSNTLGNIVAIDVLHHLALPIVFIEEAWRALKPGGRLLLLEPCVTPGSFLPYKYFHEEDVDFTYDVFSEEFDVDGDQKNPFDGNMAICGQMFVRGSKRFKKRYPQFPIIKKQYSDYFIYPLSGGFARKSLIPCWSLPVLRFMEKMIQPLGFLCAFRLFLILEKRA